MSDITKCDGKNCPLKYQCYRFTCKDGPFQSWFMSIPFDKKEQSCSYQINVKKIKENSKIEI